MSLIKKLILLLIFFIVLNIFSIFEFDYKSYLSDNESLSTLTSKNDEKDFLSSRKDESETVYQTLLPVEEDHGSIVIRREESAENNDIAYYLGRYKDRVAVFHYATYVRIGGTVHINREC
mgnify:CR=1 FL=1